jgi:DNA polymerase-1
MGPHKLADTLDISIKEAEILIDKYFAAFPSIGGFLDKLGSFGKKYGYIKTFPPYNRRRWFPNWYPRIYEEKSQAFELGSIERASKNTPIQGASADMTKLALILVRNYIKETNAPVKIVMTVHDQIDTICKIDYAETWVTEMTRLMEEAALKVVTNGLLKADTNISKSWEK